jgi:hypothetical protein
MASAEEERSWDGTGERAGGKATAAGADAAPPSRSSTWRSRSSGRVSRRDRTMRVRNCLTFLEARYSSGDRELGSAIVLREK